MSLQSVDSSTVTMSQKHKSVEGKLWEVFGAIARTEANMYLFGTLKSLGLCTNDVGNFVSKQRVHKKASLAVDTRVMRSAMHSKLTDACMHAKRLRQEKNKLKGKVLKKYQDKNVAKKILSNMVRKYRIVKSKALLKADKKISLYKERDVLEKSLKSAPPNTANILSGVNLFKNDQTELGPAKPLGPFNCSKEIKLSENELKVLSRGPKFMVRDCPTKEEFDIEVERMIVKNKYNEAFKIDEEDLQCVVQTLQKPNQTPAVNAATQNSADSSILAPHREVKTSNLNAEVDFDSKWEERAGSMVFNDVSKVLDL